MDQGENTRTNRNEMLTQATAYFAAFVLTASGLAFIANSVNWL
jgi:hypothetical protein